MLNSFIQFQFWASSGLEVEERVLEKLCGLKIDWRFFIGFGRNKAGKSEEDLMLDDAGILMDEIYKIPKARIWIH